MAFIFLDCDGTLTDRKGYIPNSAKSAIKEAQKNDHKVFLCTGRSEAEITPDLKEMCFDGFVCSSGAAIVINDELLVDKKIPKDKLLELMEVLNKYNIGYYLESPLGAFVNQKYREFMEEFMSQMGNMSDLDYYLAMIKPVEEADLSKICKLSYCKSKLKKEELQKEVPDIFKVQEDSRTNNESMGEISQTGVDKAAGIDDVLKIFNNVNSQVVAVGDGENDIEMLERADIAIAIAHGSFNLKNVADYITDEPEDDGLYKAFKHYNLI